MPTRRELRFSSLDAAVADAEMLLARGYDRAGNWSLGQCAGHMANWLTYPLDGFPPLPLFLKPIFWIVRTTSANKILDKVIREQKMQPGAATAPPSVPAATVNDQAEVERFKSAVIRWNNFSGDYIPSPLFGKQSKERFTALHLVHAAHHLSFLVPKG
jgi:Protein of unknown function (DUF1569)